MAWAWALKINMLLDDRLPLDLLCDLTESLLWKQPVPNTVTKGGCSVLRGSLASAGPPMSGCLCFHLGLYCIGT